MRSKKLSRQLKKAFGSESVEERLPAFKDALSSLANEETREELSSFLETVPDFLTTVDEAYEQLEDKANLAQRSLEVSSQELTQANSSLVSLNQTFDAMVNSLGQGFFLFGPDGVCMPVYSKACEVLLQTEPAGQKITDVLRVPEAKRATFEDWCKMLFEDVIDFEDLIEVGPKSFEHSGDKAISLEFKPVRDRAGQLVSVVVIATDRTAEIRAKQEAYKMHAFATMVTSILKDKNQFRSFVQVAREIIEDSTRVVDQRGFGEDDFKNVKRGLHTLKGAAGSFGVLQIKDLVHEIETRIATESDLAWGRDYLQKAIREVRDLFESLLSEHKELFDGVLTSNGPVRELPLAQLQRFADHLDSNGLHPVKAEFVDQFVAVSVRDVFAKFNGPLIDTAKKLGKKVDPIKIEGDEIKIVPENYDELFASLIHVFRNIADHGIESEAKRRTAGKAGAGQVRVAIHHARLQGRSAMQIDIEDDGGGIDPEKIRAKLRANGQQKLADEASREQLLNQVFAAGFSTANQVTDVSGRGVGLDAVRFEVERLGGTVSVSSEVGKGTRFTLLIPELPASRHGLERTAS